MTQSLYWPPFRGLSKVRERCVRFIANEEARSYGLTVFAGKTNDVGRDNRYALLREIHVRFGISDLFVCDALDDLRDFLPSVSICLTPFLTPEDAENKYDLILTGWVGSSRRVYRIDDLSRVDLLELTARVAARRMGAL